MRQRQGALTRIREGLRGDEGWAGSVILTVATLFLLLAAFQVALWAVGTNTAQMAAEAGYTISRSYDSTVADGKSSARQVVEQSGGLTNATVTVTRANDRVTVTVTGRVRSILPGISLPALSRTAVGPVERWVPAS